MSIENFSQQEPSTGRLVDVHITHEEPEKPENLTRRELKKMERAAQKAKEEADLSFFMDLDKAFSFPNRTNCSFYVGEATVEGYETAYKITLNWSTYEERFECPCTFALNSGPNGEKEYKVVWIDQSGVTRSEVSNDLAALCRPIRKYVEDVNSKKWNLHMGSPGYSS